jgi:hypothetical protein
MPEGVLIRGAGEGEGGDGDWGVEVRTVDIGRARGVDNSTWDFEDPKKAIVRLFSFFAWAWEFTGLLVLLSSTRSTRLLEKNVLIPPPDLFPLPVFTWSPESKAGVEPNLPIDLFQASLNTPFFAPFPFGVAVAVGSLSWIDHNARGSSAGFLLDFRLNHNLRFLSCPWGPPAHPSPIPTTPGIDLRFASTGTDVWDLSEFVPVELDWEESNPSSEERGMLDRGGGMYVSSPLMALRSMRDDPRDLTWPLLRFGFA